jgi:Homeodomain-like domain
MLVELSQVEQRYHAVVAVPAGIPVTEVATRHRVSRQSVHGCIARYRVGGLAGWRTARTDRGRARIRWIAGGALMRLRRAHPLAGASQLTPTGAVTGHADRDT